MGEEAIRNMAVLARRIDAVIPLLSGFRLLPGDAIADDLNLSDDVSNASNGRR